MTGRIEVYLDVVSLYSYVAFKQLLETRPVLEAHRVEVEIKPFLLGAINAGSGNKPPWTVPAKAKYGIYDAERTKNAFGLPEISPPEDLMAVSRTKYHPFQNMDSDTVLPLRALHYIKANYPPEAYLTTWHYFFHLFWGPVKRNIGPGAGHQASPQPLFAKHDVDGIMKATSEEMWKTKLKATVDEALERGAFGAPWLWVTNKKGDSEPFFGSDRWHYVYEFLALPYQKVELLGPEGKAKL